ncbi:FtsQ-type POTRA domain-containing protein [Patescibacteria group bacterium]|nr:FtsQ-type POTRA domain-containing protein [Patescibacteria group bacterium]
MRKVRSFRKPYRIKRKKSIFKNRFFWLTFLILILSGAIFYFFVFSSFFQVKRIIISGNESVSKEGIVAVVEYNLEKKNLFFPTKSVFLVNLDKIKKDILNSFPQIAEIEIGRGFPDVLNIIVIERLRLATWCQKDNCFLLDNEGVIFKETHLEGDLIEIIDTQKIDSVVVLGEKVIEKDYLEKILKIQKNLSEELRIGVEEFVIFNERLNVKTSDGWEIYFDPKEDLNWQITKLSLVLEEKIPPENRKDLEYIELRFGDLASFRYKQ